MQLAETARTGLDRGGGTADAPDSGGPRRRPRFAFLKPILRVAISAGLIVALLRMTSLEEIGVVFGAALERWPFLVLAALSPALGFSIVALRWKVLLGGLGFRIGLRKLCAALLVGGFFNNFLPSTIGGDLARSWWIQKTLKSSAMSLTVVAMDRFIGLVGFCAVGLLAVAAQPSVIGTLPQFWVVVAVVGGAVAGLALISRPGTVALGRRVLSTRALARFREKAALVHQGIVEIRRGRPRLFGAFILSMLLQLNIIAEFYVLSLAIDLRVGFTAFAILIPIVTLVALLPISINGIGLREGALAALGAGFGLAVQDAIILSWLFVLFTLPYAVIGGAIYAVGRGRR